MSSRHLPLTILLLCAFLLTIGDALAGELDKSSPYGGAFGISLGQHFNRSLAVRTQEDTSTWPTSIFYELKPPAPSSPFIRYFIGLTPKSALIYKIEAVSKANLEYVEYAEDKQEHLIEGAKRDECGTQFENISHVLDGKYGSDHAVLPGLDDRKHREYRIGHLHIYLICDNTGQITSDPDKHGVTRYGNYEQLKIVYSDDRMEKQRDSELDQLKTQEMDRKTRDIDSSKF